MAEQQYKDFSYVAMNAAGERTKGTMRSPSADLVATTLAQRGYTPLQVKEKGGLNADINFGSGDIKGQKLATFTRQMFTQVRAGISMTEALTLLSREQKNPKTREMLETIRDRMQEGMSFSEALGQYPGTFDRVYQSYIRQGEETGRIHQALERLATSLEKKAKIRGRVKTALTYPVVVSVAATVMVLGILFFLVPQFDALYSSLGGQLPFPTQVLVTASNILKSFWFIIPILVIGTVAFFRQTKDNLDVGTRINKIMYSFPIIGSILHKLALFRWADTLSGALASSVSPLIAVELAAEASGSRWMRKVVPAIQETLETGRMLQDVLPEFPDLYPPTISSMVKTGENAGELPTMLSSIAQTLDEEINQQVEQLSTSLEVVLLIVMGVVIGGIIVALYLPIFGAPDLISGS